MRSMGQNPTDSEVHHMINQVDVDGSGAVEFDEFCHFMVKLMKNHDPENEVKEAYRSYHIFPARFYSDVRNKCVRG